MARHMTNCRAGGIMLRIFRAFKILICIIGLAVIYFIAELFNIDIGKATINPKGE